MNMTSDQIFTIKSFKHNGHLHRVWWENWLVPEFLIIPELAAVSAMVLVNNQTRVQEADGREWLSKSPGVAFFIPGAWYNIVALIESTGIRYYCNIASPVFLRDNVLTYIDYDLDVVLMPNGDTILMDQDEYERHKISYHYSSLVEQKIDEGLASLLQRIQARALPFQDVLILHYFELWKRRETEGKEG